MDVDSVSTVEPSDVNIAMVKSSEDVRSNDI